MKHKSLLAKHAGPDLHCAEEPKLNSWAHCTSPGRRVSVEDETELLHHNYMTWQWKAGDLPPEEWHGQKRGNFPP